MVTQTAAQLTSAITADLAHLRGSLKRVDKVPKLWRLNGCGTTLLGYLRPSAHSSCYFVRLFVTVLWVPIIPLGVYLVSNSLGARYDFHGQIAPEEFHRVCRGGIGRFYFHAVGRVLATLAVVLLVVWLASLSGVRHVFLRL
jgi:hypothetical protein